MTTQSRSGKSAEKLYHVHGTVRDQHQQPLAKITVKAYEKGVRGRHLLGEDVTDVSGSYKISYAPKKAAPVALIVCVYDADKTLLKESEVQHEVPFLLRVDINLSDRSFAGISEYDQLVNSVTSFTEDVPLSELTETEKDRDISFVTQKSELPRERIERLIMAARFEKFSSIATYIWYGMLQENLPRLNIMIGVTPEVDFETRLDNIFDALMHTSIDVLMNGVQRAINENIISYAVTAELPKIRKQLSAQILSYAKKHPVTGNPSALHQKLEIAGLKGKELQSFIDARASHTGTAEGFWNSVRDNSILKDANDIQKVQAVFHLSTLTGNNLPLTEKLVEKEKIKSPADLKKLAAYDRADWESVLKEHKVKPHAAMPGKDDTEKARNYAGQLEAAFTNRFPTAAFAARLQKDATSQLPHKEAISKFLDKNEHFDLLHSRVGQFLKENKDALPEKNASEIADHLRRVQRVFKLTPSYETANLLLNDNIHSAHQIYKMGEDSFVNKYGHQLGKEKAAGIFRKAADVHAASVSLAGDLKSMADASPMNAFPDFELALTQQLAVELPTQDTLFGHADSCECSECKSVYGAPAYLTDILHFLDKRLSTLPISGTRVPSVKDLLLRRRPDIGEIDLECNNTNTEVPYIDIACELMEDFITAPISAMFSSTLLPKLVKGPIDSSLLTNIKGAFSSSGFSNFGNLLTATATVSDKYTDTRLKTDNTFSTQDNWIIRDKQIAIKVTNLGTNLQCRVLHQTLLPAEAISAGPEYLNTKAYDNFLKTAKRPFNLPFDLFNTEGELYLEKLGTKKADLIDIFSRTGPPTLLSTPDINMSYASLGINAAEQTLIFQPDTTHQSLYWGTVGSTIQVDVFEKLAGLNYAQVVNLVRLQFINPTKDSVIEHDDLSADITKQRITNITAVKLDAMHRFLRLWRKTTLTMDELDAFICIISVQNGFSNPNLNSTLADELRQFISLQQTLQLSPFELLGFYGSLDITHDPPNCIYNQVFQNSTITNPVNPNFSINAIQTQTLALGDPDKLVICSILQISLSELNALLTQTGTASIVSFITLSVIYRHAQLAHSLGISLSDLLTLLRLINTNPFQNPATTSQFIKRYQLLQSFGFSIDDLNYILRHQNNATQSLVPTTDQRSTALSQLQSDLLVIKTASAPATDTNGALLTKWLSDPVLKWDISLLNRLMDILTTVDDDAYKQKITDNTNFLLNLRMGYHDSVLTADLPALPLVSGVAIAIPVSIVAQLSFDADKKQLILKGVMSATDRDALLALSTDTVYQAAIQSLFSRCSLTGSSTANIFFTSQTDVGTSLNNLLFSNIADRFAFFINKLSPVYRKLLQSDALVKNISSWFSIDKALVNILLANVPEVFNDFTTDNFINKIIDPAIPGNPYPVQATRYQFVAKTFFIFRKLNLSLLAQEQALKLFLGTTAPIMGCLDFRSLPLTTISGSVGTFPGFEALLNLLRFDQFHPTKIIPFTSGGEGSYNIFGVLTQTTSLPGDIPSALTTMKNNLAFAYGWNAADVQTLLTLNFTVLTDFLAAPAIMLRLHYCFTVLQQLGISLADAQSWCNASLTSFDSAKIKQTLKSKYSDSDWLQVTQPLQDILREKKRDALIAYLLANPGTQTWKDANDLYSYFLLDVQMCSCQPTSRIVEATNAVQLFVQRCFLNLEDSVVVKTKLDSNTSISPDLNWLQWKWMKNFRVWQSNIKVFLYPENYIEPELLPDDIKSSFLKDLENDLLQKEVTAINAEDAFHNYLEKLEGIARLEVKGMWYDQPLRTLHVFARSYGGNPRVYYHRKFINDKRWTPWTKVDQDITSDHVIPAMYNNRLYLFWAVFTQQADKAAASISVPHPDASGNYTIPIADPKKNWQIQLAFSEYKNGKWTAKKVSEANETGQIVVPQTTFPDRSKFVLTMLDIPNFDYSKIFVAGDPNHAHIDAPDVFNRKAAAAIRQNGKLVISCYYYDYVNNDSFDNNRYVGSFQLDPVKGYPTQLLVNYKIKLKQASSHIERSNRKSVMLNMLDAESFTGINAGTPPTNGIPGSGPSGQVLVAEQAGGPFGSLVPLQLDLNDRYNYMNNIYSNLFSGSFQFQLQVGSSLPYFYQDQRRNYYIVNEFTNNGAYEFLYSDNFDLTLTLLEQGATAYITVLNQIDAALGLPAGTLPVFTSRYFNFHHPLVDYFIQSLFANGIDGLMDRQTQLKGDFGYDSSPGKFDFRSYFQPVIAGFDTIYSGSGLPPVTHNGITDPTPGYPKDDVDFNLQSGYGLYNWELFFHAPLMIAERLSQNQQFEDADRWYRYIFNPMDTSGNPSPSKYWNTRPFFLNTNTDYINQRIDNILKGINNNQLDLVKNVDDWRNNPFQPHFIAQYRTVAYQKAAVMKYVAHLVRHGDYLFQQHTIESVNEATQLYILAAEILGPKPEVISSPVTTSVDNYYQLEQKLDAFSDALIDVENLVPFQVIKGYNGIVPTNGLPTLRTMYFCIPMNENLTGPTGYWDLVADRLFKIRHCLNIDGTVAPLSLFAPSINPGLLVRASAAGLDIGTVINDMNGAMPLYRFMAMIQKATELCNEVKSLGAAMLSALEKKDAETMVLLRSGHEIKMLSAVLVTKQKQVEEAQASLDNLNKQKELITIRKAYYNDLVIKGLSDGETAALILNTVSAVAEIGITLGYALAGGLSLIPQFVVGASGLGSPVATASEGGQQVAAAADHASKTLSSIAAAADKSASVINTKAVYDRRSDEWKYQINLATKELEQVEKQLLGAQIRLDIVRQDLANQQLQIDLAREENDFMHGKFTNEDLFSWMSTRVSDTYFKSYQLAYDIAKRTEQCFRYELGLGDSAYINFGYWDSLKKGLLAGEQLFYDIRKMEMAYYEQNKRELELTKPVSLSQLDPVALLKLKTTGDCWINLPEELFDMDYPGHYMRRIKSVSITIPCISGPYTTVSCKLTMTKNSLRTSGVASDATQYPRKLSNGMPADDPRFRDAVGALQSIATSNAQNDSGLFELSFRDERYLPFEGAGAISLWHLQLPAAVRQFDYNTISDVIISLRYTARDGGEALRANATASLNTRINQMLVSTKDTGLMRIFSAKNDLSTEWYRFLHPLNTTDDQVLTLNLDNSRFPLFVQGKTIKIRSIELVADSTIAPVNNIQLIPPSSAPDSLNLTATGIYGTCLSVSKDYSSTKKDPGTWIIINPVANPRLTEGAFNNLVIIVHYEVS